MSSGNNARKDSFVIRALSAVVGIPILIALLYAGRISFFFLVLVLTLLASMEFYKLFKKNNNISWFLILLGAALFTFGVLIKEFLGAIIASGILVILSLGWLIFYKKAKLKDFWLTLFGPLYVGFLFSYLILIYDFKDIGKWLVLIVFVSTWVYDISAYGLGKAFGRRKLAPSISPNKTWEGVILGAVVTILFLSSLYFIGFLPLYKRLLLGFVVSIAAPVGDLIESKLKRSQGVKDTGPIIPGHGGILDRFDSLLFTGMCSYYLFRLIL